jgi:hypothetical protein
MIKIIIIIVIYLFHTLSLAESSVGPFNSTKYKLNYEDLNMIWNYVKQETGASPDFPAPDLHAYDKPLPRDAIMAFSYPTKELSGTLGVFVPTTTINKMGKENPLLFTWCLGHEFTHYAMFLRKNNWQITDQFPKNRDQHCDPEFQRITYGIADLIFEKYRSKAAREKMYSEVERDCRVAPVQ